MPFNFILKAAVYFKYGPPEVVSLHDVPIPDILEDELLIRVMNATVNRTDCGFRSAEYFISRFFSGLLKPKNKILGCEFSGIVTKIGSKVTEFKVGDRVFGFNDTRFGAHAEYMVLKSDSAFTLMPDTVDFQTAACLSEGAHYALCDIRAAKVTKGQKVLVNGATGAIGSAAIQLCLALGAEVTAVCATQHIEKVRSLGPHKIIDYKKEDFTRLEERFDLVFDAVGKSRFKFCKRILKPRGIYISTELGPRGENIFLALWTSVFSKKKLLFPLPVARRSDLEYIKSLYESGQFKPLIDRQYPLDSIVEAHKYVETGMKVGNVVISIGHTP